MTDTKILHEIEEVQAKIETLSKQRKYSLNNIFLQLGLFFFLIFLLSITQTGALFNVLSTISFAILSISLLKTSADIFYFKRKDAFYVLLGVALLLIIGLSYMALWMYVFSYHALLLSILIGVLLFLATAFYLLHALLSYHHNKAKRECLITGGLVALGWLFLLLSSLYGSMLTYLLSILITLILLKAVIDFSAQFVRRKE